MAMARAMPSDTNMTAGMPSRHFPAMPAAEERFRLSLDAMAYLPDLVLNAATTKSNYRLQ
jgi:hypothetical protein